MIDKLVAAARRGDPVLDSSQFEDDLMHRLGAPIDTRIMERFWRGRPELSIGVKQIGRDRAEAGSSGNI